MNNCYIIHRSNDVLNIIFNKLPLTSQLRFRATCKKFREKLDITDLYNIPRELRYILTDKIVLQYPKLRELNASYNPKITDASIKELTQLRELDADYNQKITDV
jgi:Leucine-rich repeat (LRR) protein